MTIDGAQNLQQVSEVKPALTIQHEVQKEVLKETMSGEGIQKQLLAMMASSQPQQSVQATAQNQISRGFLDIKV